MPTEQDLLKKTIAAGVKALKPKPPPVPSVPPPP